jgi:hypothetical protein
MITSRFFSSIIPGHRKNLPTELKDSFTQIRTQYRFLEKDNRYQKNAAHILIDYDLSCVSRIRIGRA